MTAAHQQCAKQSQKDARPNRENTACGTTPSEENCIRGTRPTNPSVRYLDLVTPHTRYSSDQPFSTLLGPGHPTYVVLVRPTLQYATWTWSPHIRGTRPTNPSVRYLDLVTPHTRYSSDQPFSTLLGPGHPTYEVLVRPTLQYATWARSPNIRGARPTNPSVRYLGLVTPHTRCSSDQPFSTLLGPGHPTYEVLVRPTLQYATWTWSPHIRGTRPTNPSVRYLGLVTQHTRYSSDQPFSTLLGRGHPTYEVLVRPTLQYATWAWSPHIRGTRPTNPSVRYLDLVTPHTRYSSD